MSELLRVGRTALLVGVLGVAAPFLAGFALLWLWGGSRIEAVFTGAALVATSVGITAQVLAAKGSTPGRGEPHHHGGSHY